MLLCIHVVLRNKLDTLATTKISLLFGDYRLKDFGDIVFTVESSCLRRWMASVPDVNPVPDRNFLQVNQYSLSVFVSLVLSVGGVCATVPDCGN